MQEVINQCNKIPLAEENEVHSSMKQEVLQNKLEQ
jgi:hypothetical protein